MRLIIVLLLLLFPIEGSANTFSKQLMEAALERTTHHVRYDGRYFAIPYPNGDIPQNLGVCTDVVIRSYRTLGIDLQQLVHKDIKANFDRYPSKRIWGLHHPDSNIDHRRVPVLQAFFTRNGKSLPVSNIPEDYQAGDLVTWMIQGNLPHIGIVTDKLDAITGVPLIVHNIGNGPVLENILFKYRITGHYRYIPR